jgi:predicted enzyme related to lactoylglutathione lyase
MVPDAVASLYMVNLDCADPRGMAIFYSALLGWDAPYCEEEYSMISNGLTSIGFGRIDGYIAAPWPDEQHSKQYHLDLQVEDLAQAQATSRQLGATVPEFQPGGDRWRVCLDPEGRPFCLVPIPAES